MRTGFLLLLGRNLRIGFLKVFNICKLRSELIVAPFFENFTNKFPSLSQQTLAMILTAQVCSLDLFLLFLPAASI